MTGSRAALPRGVEAAVREIECRTRCGGNRCLRRSGRAGIILVAVSPVLGLIVAIAGGIGGAVFYHWRLRSGRPPRPSTR
jgi:hypothetical protein